MRPVNGNCRIEITAVIDPECGGPVASAKRPGFLGSGGLSGFAGVFSLRILRILCQLCVKSSKRRDRSKKAAEVADKICVASQLHLDLKKGRGSRYVSDGSLSATPSRKIAPTTML